MLEVFQVMQVDPVEIMLKYQMIVLKSRLEKKRSLKVNL